MDTLVILGGNPVYNAPADLDWAAAQAKAKTVIRLGYYEDETFARYATGTCRRRITWKSWGDARTSDGTLVPVQPLIEPLFGGLTELECSRGWPAWNRPTLRDRPRDVRG